MEKSNFDRLIERYLTGVASEEERVKLEAWLDVMKTKEGTDRELSAEDEERVFQQLTSRISKAERSMASQTALAPRLSLWRTSLRFAAALIVVLVSGYVIWFALEDTSSGNHRFRASGEIERVLLEDGTLVWLHRNSTLDFHQPAGQAIRQATLTGEALFEVAKDPDKPFVIACDDVTVRVVGTSFNLRSKDHTVELKVLTGKVRMSTANNREGVVILPNEIAIYREEKLIERKTLTPSDKHAITRRTTYDMDFHNVSMEQIALRIHSKFDVEVTFEHEDLRRCGVTGDFTDYSLEKTLTTLSELLDLKYDITGKTVTLNGKGCP